MDTVGCEPGGHDYDTPQQHSSEYSRHSPASDLHHLYSRRPRQSFASMGATTLQSLPRELHLKVAELSRRPDLIALSSTCKLLRQVAEPLIYHSIHLRLNKDFHSPPIGLLLRTILESSSLAHHVRRLNFDGDDYGTEWNPREDRLPNPVPQPGDELCNAIKSLDVEQETAEAWSDQVQLGSPGAISALIVSLCGNLSSLRMDHNWTAQAHFVGHLLRPTAQRVANNYSSKSTGCQEDKLRFHSLRAIELHQRYNVARGKHPQDLQNTPYLFYLPRIEHMSVPLLNPEAFHWPFNNKPDPSNLTYLSLDRVRECFLGDILSPLTNLQKLRYNWFLREDVDVHVKNKRTVDITAIVNAVLLHRGTLTEFTLRANTVPAWGFGCYEPPNFWLHGSLQPLSELVHLTRLCLPFAFVAGVWEAAPTGSIASVMPVGLQHLTLESSPKMDGDTNAMYWEWDDEWILSYIRRELESGALRPFTELRSFTVPGPDRTEPDQNAMAEKKRLSEEFNIRILFEDYREGSDE